MAYGNQSIFLIRGSDAIVSAKEMIDESNPDYTNVWVVEFFVQCTIFICSQCLYDVYDLPRESSTYEIVKNTLNKLNIIDNEFYLVYKFVDNNEIQTN